MVTNSDESRMKANNRDREQQTEHEERRGRNETNIQALHSSGCLKGKARPLSIAAILMQESELLSGHSASYSEGREDQRRHQ